MAVESNNQSLTIAQRAFEKVMQQFQEAFNQDPSVLKDKLRKKVSSIKVDFSGLQILR